MLQKKNSKLGEMTIWFGPLQDGVKSFVVVTTRLWSSIYTQDKQLRSFFRMIRPLGYSVFYFCLLIGPQINLIISTMFRGISASGKRLKSLPGQADSSNRALASAYPSDAHEIVSNDFSSLRWNYLLTFVQSGNFEYHGSGQR